MSLILGIKPQKRFAEFNQLQDSVSRVSITKNTLSEFSSRDCSSFAVVSSKKRDDAYDML